ncbi:hypothetical protein CEP52_010467 [Fusarium oligoseptatum]|uniref:Uncharacterized protein n=1 Tax=Fusarium oligoseptatum TaxID=2604345 RepID=A0A428T7Y4_9HYPO|nr:hypothetical protein CEP52_010467 [Fusarium oligoseptatum]
MATELQVPNTGSFLLRDKESTVTKIQLNPGSFSVLREAVADGMQLPASSAEFERRYERRPIQAFLERDPGVYDYVLEVFVTIHGTCERFKSLAGQDMPAVGQLLVRVADSAIELLGVRLNALVQEQTDRNIRSLLEELSKRLEELSQAASDLAKKSASMGQHIIEFKVKSRKNYEDVAKVNERWDKARISDEEWQRKMEQDVQARREEAARLEKQAEKIRQVDRFAPPKNPWVWDMFRAAETKLPITQLLQAAGLPFRSLEELEEAFKNVESRSR